MLTLALALLLAGSPSPTPRPLVVTALEPTNAAPGDRVTVRGHGLDGCSLVFFGDIAPWVAERGEDHLVFIVPYNTQSIDGYKAMVHVLTPGQKAVFAGELYVGGVRPRSTPAAVATPRPPKAGVPDRPLRERVLLKPGEERTLRFDAGSAAEAELRLACDGGDVAVSAQAADAPDKTQKAATKGGSLQALTISRAAMGETRPLPLGKIVLTLRNAAASVVDCGIRLEAVESAPKRPAPPK